MGDAVRNEFLNAPTLAGAHVDFVVPNGDLYGPALSV